jgi:hypothetical protein
MSPLRPLIILCALLGQTPLASATEALGPVIIRAIESAL